MKTKKIPIIASFLMLLCASSLYCQQGKVLYTEGEVTIRDRAGGTHDAAINEMLEAGYTVTTGRDGYAELDKSGSLITLSANTVFQFLETARNGRKRDVFSAVSGAVYLKIKKLTGSDEDSPFITSPSTTLGVRGTAFTVYAGVDGSSLVAVAEGRVAVESAGASVELAANEGVEVKPGAAPGAKFTVLKGELDFKSWSERNLDAFLADPVAAAKRIEERLSNFVANLRDTKAEYDKSFAILKTYRDTLATIEEKQERQKYYDSTVAPQEVLTTNYYFNIRYYALSSLSLRRYVLGRMYMNVKSLYMTRQAEPVFENFVAEYRNVLSLFEKEIVPFLVDADF
jgi:hypothetical protein